ncbi:MAG TPA: hypothetical protein VEQ60_10080, partial [Longimicrobium sp.]|nr:hypothetical protein [Longimicrobium sp.]
MPPRPTGWNRLVAKLQGEVPAAELEAFRRASAPVMELLEQVERRRLECRIDGLDPWAVPPATRAAFLCAWNAFVLQTSCAPHRVAWPVRVAGRVAACRCSRRSRACRRRSSSWPLRSSPRCCAAP